MLEFAELFQGSDLAHGHSIVSEQTNEVGKQESKSWTDKGPPLEKDWDDHLNGIKGLGLAPINSKSEVRWGAIDIDSYDLDLKDLNDQIVSMSLPVVLCRSKSGGPHLYLFCKEPVPAALMVSTLEAVAASLGYGTSEIFPKQTSITVRDNVTDWGNWINLPYFGGDNSLRYALNNDGEAILSVSEFVDFCKQKSIFLGEETIKSFEEPEEVFPEGPPCLNRIWSSSNPQDMRNVSLCNAAVYLKQANPETWKDALDAANRLLKDPLSSGEVEAIKKSYEKKDYRYQCDKEPLSRYCNASLCRKRRFGVGGKGALPVHRSLTKINTVPPIWCLDVQTSSGVLKRITMETDDLQNPSRYQKRCMEVLDEIPPVLKKDEWDRVLRTLFRHVNHVDVPYEMSPEGQFIEILSEFILDTVSDEVDRSFEDLIRGIPYQDSNFFYFRMKDLNSHLRTQQFTALKPNQITAVIREKLKGQKGFKNIKGKGVNFWEIPVELLMQEKPEDQTVPKVDNEPF